MEAHAKMFILLFIILALLVINTTATLGTTNLELGEIKWSMETGIEKYHYEPGLYCQGDYHSSGCVLKNQSKLLDDYRDTVKNHSNYDKHECVLLKNFKVLDFQIFGEDDDGNWYAIDIITDTHKRMRRMMPSLDYLVGLGDHDIKNKAGQEFLLNYAKTNLDENAAKTVNTESALNFARKNLDEKALGARLLALAEKDGSVKTKLEAYKALKEMYPAENDLYANVGQLETIEKKLRQKVTDLEKQLAEKITELQSTQNYFWYGVLILGIVVLVLLAIIAHISIAQNSNTNRKLKVGDRVKVRNTTKQKWRTGVVQQALKVEVDGWQKAHIWNHVERIKPVSESTQSHGEEKSETNELSKNMTEKENRTKTTNDSKVTEEVDKKLVATKSSLNSELDDSTEPNENTVSDSMSHTTKDNTITPTETITETEETKSVYTTTDESEKTYHSNSEASTSRN